MILITQCQETQQNPSSSISTSDCNSDKLKESDFVLNYTNISDTANDIHVYIGSGVILEEQPVIIRGSQELQVGFQCLDDGYMQAI